MNLIHLFTIPLLVLTFSSHTTSEKTINPIPSRYEVISKTPPDREEDAEYIPWITERKLTWDDYQCEPVRNTDAVASTSTSLGLSYQIINSKLTYHITCGFSKVKSWGLLKTDYILAHEQGHFDITEIFARKLYEALLNYHMNKRTFKKDINEIYQGIVKEKEDYQQTYDGETDHSRNHKIQSAWLEKIDQMLQDTEPFVNYP